ncbi:HIV Tat-specific factor 1 homolog isoform X2 [Limulus polyphemus]|nr:HIV Tat-specific factor 1 homolog isoform X2 [Limulus polyphemus]XP_022237173.1 HIV Tat-specific factor 1 homolog isoform X2 [Limulus polyphemus]
MSEDDFEAQLKLEKLEKQKQETDWSLPSQGDPYTYVDPTDGTVFEWDSQKKAWFPKIDDDFIAAYQANYGVSETSTSQSQDALSTTSTLSDIDSQEIAGKKRKANNEPGWFDVDEAHNTNVYVAGLPLDTTEEEFVEVMSKCGLIMKDPDRGLYKIKLYRNPDGSVKGDALCCYIKVESVDLALKILDGSRVRGHVIHVERATFQMKGKYDPSKKPRKKKSKEKEKLKKKLNKLFDWRPEMLRGQRLRCERVVVIKNMFDPKEFEVDATLILEYQKDLRDECSKCGEVKKVTIYDRHPEGVVLVTFKEPEEADQCIALMNKRWFAGRQLSAETWDGRTKYTVIETEDEKKKRLETWEGFLEGGTKTDKPVQEECSVKMEPILKDQPSTEQQASTLETAEKEVVADKLNDGFDNLQPDTNQLVENEDGNITPEADSEGEWDATPPSN